MTNRDKTAEAYRVETRTTELIAAAVAGARKDNPGATHSTILLEAVVRLQRAALKLNSELQVAAK